jgi:hypothetical protein
MKLRLFCMLMLLALPNGRSAHSDEALKVKNALEAMQASLLYLRERNPQIAPPVNIQWREKTIYSDGPADLVTTSKQFTSDAWIIEVFQELAPLRNIEYRVAIFSPTLGLYWKGSVKADGGIKEEDALRQLSDDEKQKKTEELLMRSQTPAPVGGYGH